MASAMLLNMRENIEHLQNNNRWALSWAPNPTRDALVLAVAGLLQRGHGPGKHVAPHAPDVCGP